MRSFINQFTLTSLTILSTACQKGSPSALPVVIAGSPHQSDHLAFDWKIYEDPARPEFWADGADGILPRPFLHLAATPTPENAARLLAWQKRQWQVIEEVIRSLGGASELKLYSDLVGKDVLKSIAENETQPGAPLLAASLKNESGPKDADSEIPWHEVGLVYIYRSSCGVCQRQGSLIKSLKDLGAKTITLQINAKDEAALYGDSQDYHQGDWASFFPLDKAQTTPSFFIAKKGKSPLKHLGSLTLAQLTQILKTQVMENADAI
jgi:hypothetical protein